MAQKNRALALLTLAGVYTRQGKAQHAAVAMQMASTATDFPKLVQAARQVAAKSGPARQSAASKARLQRAAAWPFRQTATVGDDLREEPSEQNHLREVQEGAIEDDLALMGLDDGGEEFADFDDFDPSVTDGVDDLDDADYATASDEGDDEEDDADKEEGSQQATVLARALANLNARQMAAKKAKKKPAKGKK